MPRQKLTVQDVYDIKEALWNQWNHATIARQFGISTAYVSFISTGRVYWDIPWPDGSTGELPLHRKRFLVNLRSENSRLSRMLERKEIVGLSGIPMKEIESAIAEADAADASRAEREYQESVERSNAARESLPPIQQQALAPISLSGPSWETILSLVPNNPYVTDIEASGDEKERRILRSIFGGIPQGQWATPLVRRLQEQIRKQVEERGYV